MIDLNVNLVTDLKMLLVAWSNYNLVPLVSLKQDEYEKISEVGKKVFINITIDYFTVLCKVTLPTARSGSRAPY